MLTIEKCFLTKNSCYGKAPIKPKGIIVHSTGANNPYLKRYIQPDDGKIGVNKYNNHWNRSGVNKCVHAFIGKDKDGVVRVYQTLPFTQCAWGVGKGKKGSYNYAPNGYIQFEICEDNLKGGDYFINAFYTAAEFCAMLCLDYNLPISRVISHHEAYLEGYASNHGDCDKWLKAFGRNMKWFRDLVAMYYDQYRGLDYLDSKAEAEPEAPLYHIVEKGDSLSKIAKKYGVSLDSVKKLNKNISAPLYIIRVGQKVRVK